MKKGLALFSFAIGIFSVGFSETASAQGYPANQCTSIPGGYYAADAGSCSFGDISIGAYLNATCAATGVCCVPSGTAAPAPQSCVAQTCLNTPNAYCGTFARSGYQEGVGTCASGRCYAPGAGGTCASRGGVCVVGNCSQQGRRASDGTCIGPDAGETCCTTQTFPACSGTCRIANCNAGESVVNGAICQGNADVCCSAPVVALPRAVTGPLMSDYQLLEHIPGSSNSAGRLNTYLEDIYRFAFWTIGIAVVFMLTIGGFMYLTSAGNTSRMENAKTVIFDAILGLVLALVAWLFLYVINPDLVKVSLPSASITPTMAPVAPPAVQPTSVPSSQSAWPDDADERGLLAAGISVNRGNCTFIGQTACTSLADTAAIPALNGFQAACGNCPIMITGGTECWLHGSQDPRCNGTDHKPGDYAIDLDHSAALDNYIRSNGMIICSPRGRPLYRIGNSVFWDESTHWHANFNHASCSGF